MAYLTLTITNTENIKAGIEISKVFDEKGGTIGRSWDNDWVLIDPHVSSRHAVLVFKSGQFLIEDISRNGISLNGASAKIEKGVKYPLHDVRSVRIGPFNISVKVLFGIFHLYLLNLRLSPSLDSFIIFSESINAERYL